MNYAAILADHEISRDEIVPELKKRGWQVVSKEIEPYDELPSVILVWILFDWKTLGYRALPCQYTHCYYCQHNFWSHSDAIESNRLYIR